MKQLLSTLLAFAYLLTSGNLALAQQTSLTQPVISFAQTKLLPQDTLVSVPVHINTNRHKLDSLQVKINVTGEVEQLDVDISSQIPVQEINRVIADNSIFVTITSMDIGKTWSAQANTELLNISFMHQGEGTVELSFDAANTLAASDMSEDNVLQVGNNQTINFGEITPDSVEAANQQETAVATMTPAVANDSADELPTTNNQETVLVVIIIASLAAVGGLLFYMMKNKRNNPEV